MNKEEAIKYWQKCVDNGVIGGKDVPVKYRSLWGRVMSGNAGRPDAVKLKCLECCGYELPISKDCGVFTCPLYMHSPRTRHQLD